MAKYTITPPLPVLNRAHSLAKGLVACYPFFERGGTILRNIASRDTPGTLTNMTPATAWIRTHKGYALNFDGINDYVSIPDNAKFDFGGLNPFSVAAWVKTPGSTNNMAIISKSDAGPPYNGWQIRRVSGGLLCFDILETLAERIEVYGSTTLTGNRWYHVVATYDGSGLGSGVRLYLDGRRETETVVANSGPDAINNNLNVLIGARPNSGGAPVEFWVGAIDGVCIWNRALTTQEVRTLYQNPTILYQPSKLIFNSKKYTPISQISIRDITPPVLSNLIVSTGVSNGELNISFDYSDVTSTVPHCEIAIARTSTDLPSGVYTGSETDNLTYDTFKPIYKTLTNELPAMANNASGTYSVTLKLPDNGKVYVTVSARDGWNNWANWMTPASGTVKGDAVFGGCYTWG